MNLVDMFVSNQINGTGQVQESALSEKVLAQKQALTEALLGLKAGDTLQAEIVGKDGNTVTLSFGGDLSVQARLSGLTNLNPGASVTFEVRSNGSALTLTPLFTNLATDTTAMKALSQASLPANNVSVSMVRQMMQNGMGIDRNSLQQVYGDVVTHSNRPVSDVIDLHRLGMPVTEENLTQIGAYKNLSYQLDAGLHSAATELNQMLDTLVQKGDFDAAGKVFTQILEIAAEVPDEDLLREQTISLTEDAQGSGNIGSTADAKVPVSKEGTTVVLADPNVTIKENASAPSTADSYATSKGVVGAEIEREAIQTSSVDQTKDVVVEKMGNGQPFTGENIADSLAFGEESAAQRALRLLQTISDEQSKTQHDGQSVSASGGSENVNQGQIPTAEKSTEMIFRNGFEPITQDTKNELLHFLKSLSSDTDAKFVFEGAESKTSMSDIFTALKNELENALGHPEKARKILENPLLRQIAFSAVRRGFSISPEQFSSKEKVLELYQRLDRQLQSLARGMTDAGLEGHKAFSEVRNMSNNLDFLNQVNQMYNYIQLPLRFAQGDSAHGDLYVYSNGKKLSSNDAKVTALLHLDMEHLGPLDVYVSMDNSFVHGKVNTNFTVADESVLDLIEAHMDELTERLNRRGYDYTFSTKLRGDESEDSGQPSAVGGGVNVLLQKSGGGSFSDVAFDVRT